MCQTIVRLSERATEHQKQRQQVGEAACHSKSVGAEAIELDIVFHLKANGNGDATLRAYAILFTSFRSVIYFVQYSVEQRRIVALRHPHF